VPTKEGSVQGDKRDRTVHALLAGGVGGLAGTWAMNEFQRLWSAAVDDRPPESAGGKHDARDWQERDEQQNSNELAAQALAHALLGRRLTRSELQVVAPMLHFAFGATMAALYGRWADRRADANLATGLGFGIALWLVADEMAMPVFRLSGPTSRRPLEMHLQAFASHLVYGAMTELVRQPMDRLLHGGEPTADRTGRRWPTS
jgi:hypothetical protein